MGIASFAQATVTVQRATVTTDRYGRETRDWSNLEAEFDLSGCSVQPMVGAETFDAAGGRVVSRWHFSAPGRDADVQSTDRIVYDGDTFEVDGSVRRWLSPSGRLGHVEAILKRVE